MRWRQRLLRRQRRQIDGAGHRGVLRLNHKRLRETALIDGIFGAMVRGAITGTVEATDAVVVFTSEFVVFSTGVGLSFGFSAAFVRGEIFNSVDTTVPLA